MVARECEILSRAEKYLEKKLEKVQQDYRHNLDVQEKRVNDWVRRATEALAGYVKELEGALVASGNRREILAIHAGELEKEVDHLKAAVEASEKKYHEELMDRATHVKLLTESYQCARDSAEATRLRPLSSNALVIRSEGNISLGLDELVDKLWGLQGRLHDVVMHEGRQVAAEVAEYVLVCLHSHNPEISLEPV